MNLKFYKEKETGDYLCVDLDTNSYYKRNLGKDYFEGRAVSIINQPSSICTTGISREFIVQDCEEITKKDVPINYLKRLI